jgi:hypothetical protein
VEEVMVRPAILVVFAALFTACAASTPAPTAQAPPPREPTFASDTLRDEACLAVRDHAVVVFADEWAGAHGVSVATPEEHEALYSGFNEAMREKGTLGRFAAHCTVTLTPKRYLCAMSSHTSDRLVKCMTDGAPG